MPIVALLIGVILVVAAVRNSQDALFSALATDAPKFVVWAAAIFAVGAIGFIPGLRPVSRLLLALVVVVLVVNNYQAIVNGFTNAWQNPPKAGSSTSSGASTAPASSATSAAQGATQTFQEYLEQNPPELEE